MHRLYVVLIVSAAACGGTTPAPQAPAGSAEPVASAASVEPTAATELPASVCENRGEGFEPVQLTSAQLALRHGDQARTFADVVATKDRPIEVCGPTGEREWLRRVTCVDGSKPFASPEAARDARTGNVGPGGRCGSIIDRYNVRCPEATYEVFMDMYMCPEGGF